jgi:hypothetical protein
VRGPALQGRGHHLDAGKFALSGNGATVTVQADSGAVVAEVPLTFEVAGHAIPVAA